MIDYPFIPNNRGKQINIRVPIYLECITPYSVIKVVCEKKFTKSEKVHRIRIGTSYKRMLVLICVFLSKSFV